MTELEVIELMRALIKKYDGYEEERIHESNGKKYIRFEIWNWNNNLNFYPGTLSIRSLTGQTGGTGLQKKEPRLSKAEFSKKFGIPQEAFLHRAWGQGSYRTSVGIIYNLVKPDNLRNLIEWSLQQHGKKSDEAHNIHEKLCMDILDKIFNIPSKRDMTPEWLSTGNRGSQRLDGYWEELKLAAEYNGLQHYEMVDYFHKGDIKNFEAQQERDEKKREACKEAEINLVEIPYWLNLTEESIIQYLKENYDTVFKLIKEMKK
jgi:hypothetical protein